jgi:hypothetical protein
MTKRKDGIVIVSTFKKTKGPSKSTVSSMKEPIQTSKEELDDMNGFIVNGVFRLKPNDDNNRLLLQKAYIEDEKSLYKRKPFDSGFMELHNKPMPSEFRVRGH